MKMSGRFRSVSDSPLFLVLTLNLRLIALLIVRLQSFFFSAYFTCIAQALFNLNLVQVATKLTCNLSDEQRVALKITTSIKMDSDLSCDKKQGFTSLLHLLGYIVDCLGEAGFYASPDLETDYANRQISYKKVYSESEFNEFCMRGCLPYLRTAAMLQHHLYTQPFPEIKVEESSIEQDSDMESDDKDSNQCLRSAEQDKMMAEFSTLVRYLGIGSAIFDRKQPSEDSHSLSLPSIRDAASLFQWACSDARKAVKTWVGGYIDFYSDSPLAAKVILRIISYPERNL